MPKLLLLTHSHRPVIGGSTVVYDALARNCSTLQMQVMAACIHVDTGVPIEGVAAFDQSASYPIHRIEQFRLPDRNSPYRGIAKRWVNLVLSIQAYRAVSRLVRREGIDMLLVGNINSLSWLGVALRARWGIPFALYLHGEELSMKMHNQFYQWKRRINLRLADRLYCASAYCMDYLVGHFPGTVSTAFLVGNGVDIAKFKAARTATVRPHGQPLRLIGIGRQVERKGFDMAIRAFAKARQQLPGLRLTLVGDGPLHSQLRELAVDLGVGDAVDFKGAVDDRALIDAIASADVFIMPNRTLPDGDAEGFGLVFLEANAAGKPVIAGRSGGAVGAVDDGYSGFLVDPTSVDEIAARIRDYACQPDLLAKMSTQAIFHAERFSWTTLVARFEQDALELISNRGRGR